MTITIRQLHEQDWEILKSIRLKALQRDPSVFSSNYKKEVEKTSADWRGWLNKPEDYAVFGLFNGDDIIGMTGIALNRDDPTRTSAALWGSWIEPEHRGKGFSGLYYQARITWAEQHPTCKKIIVSHRASNIASKMANQKYGFLETHREWKTWPDGTEEDDIFYVRTVVKNPIPPA